jgi:hypothetical protein
MATNISIGAQHDDSDPTAAESSAAIRLYRAELALHDARQSHVDAWIAAAADQLHLAAVRYRQLKGAETAQQLRMAS